MTLRTYRIDPQYRRCCWYMLGSMPLVQGVAAAVGKYTDLKPANVVMGCLLLALIASALAWPLSWRLRVDARGIARGRLFWWDHWTWQDLASGRVRKEHPFILHDPARPWWRRRLTLGYLTEGDQRALVSLINEHYRLPPPPALSDSLTIRYGHRRIAVLDSRSIRINDRGRLQDYSWRDVRQAHITRVDPLRRDFSRLVIELPDREIELQILSPNGHATPSWRGAGAEVVNEFLLRHLPSERVETHLVGEPPARRSSIERDLRRAERSEREYRSILWLFGASMLIWTGYAALDRSFGLVRALAMTAIGTIIFVPVITHLERLARRRVEQLRHALQSLAGKPYEESGLVAGEG